MSNLDDYNSKLAIIMAIESDKTPTMPVDVAIDEGEELFWSTHDKAVLTADGLEEGYIEDLKIRIGACREAESRWVKERKSRKASDQEWNEKSPEAYTLRDKLLHKLQHAYRKNNILSIKVKDIAQGTGHADMIQDLNDLAVLGKDYPDGLSGINFDLTLLDQAASMSDEMGDLLGRANGDRKSKKPSKIIRDKAYLHMKEATDEIRACGKYSFWKNKDRLKGYASDYLR